MHGESAKHQPRRKSHWTNCPGWICSSRAASAEMLSTRRCPANTRDFIANGAPEGERNNRLFKAACDLAGNHFDLQRAASLLLPIAQQCGLPLAEAEATLRSAYSKPRVIRPNRIRAVARHERVRAWVESQVWSGRTGQTDRAVLLACCRARHHR